MHSSKSRLHFFQCNKLQNPTGVAKIYPHYRHLQKTNKKPPSVSVTFLDFHIITTLHMQKKENKNKIFYKAYNLLQAVTQNQTAKLKPKIPERGIFKKKCQTPIERKIKYTIDFWVFVLNKSP